VLKGSECLKFQLNQASSFEVIVLDSRASKKIDLYSNHTENRVSFRILAEGGQNKV